MDYWTGNMRSGQKNDDRPKDLDWKLELARAIIAAERAWALSWPGLGWLGLYAVLSLFGLWTLVPGWLHTLGLAALGLPLLKEALRFNRSFLWPSRDEGLARLERDSELTPSALRQLEDRPAHHEPQALRLWHAYQQRLKAQIRALKVKAPFLSLVRLDPYALRILIAVLVLTGLISAGRDSGRYLLEGLSPDFGGAPSQIVLDVWVTPPDYTGRPPLLLSRVKEGESGPILIPTGSKLSATLAGGWRTPWARIGKEKTEFEDDGGRNYRLEAVLAAGQGLDIGQGTKLHRHWPIQIVGDEAPIVVFPSLPEETLGQALKIEYEAYDDYGIETMLLEISGSDGLFGDKQDIDLTPPLLRGEDPGQGVTYQDLTPSQWAGEDVEMMLVASDGLGQVGRSLPITVTLPERSFNHPVARVLIDIRKELFRSPEKRNQPSRYLDAIAQAPEHYADNLLVYTGLRAAHWRLVHDPALDAVRDVTRILWDIALELEEGQLGAAQRALREAMQDLMSALQQGDESKLPEMMEQFRQKMNDMLRAQMERMQNQGDVPQNAPQPMNGESQLVTPSMLDRMMQQIEDMAAAGDMQGAMDMLAQMQAMMENLASSQPLSQEDMERAMAAGQALQGLENLMEMQRNLMNDTVRQSLGQNPGGERQQPGQGQSEGEGQAGQGWQGLAEDQNGLGEALDGIGETLGKAGLPTPGALENAARAMARAENSLSQGDGIPSIRNQGQALDALKSARDALGEALDEAMQQMQAAGARQDPLGRPNNQGLSNENVKIPTEADYLRTREIREELQRRLADPNRPASERSYIRRLLERFR